MTDSAMQLLRSGERAIRVVAGRVACPRIGPVDLDRCRECDYLLGLQLPGSRGSLETEVVCVEFALGADIDFVW